MGKFFTQTAEHSIKIAARSEELKRLPEVIRKYTDWNYTYKQTDTGYFLKPVFHNMPYRNSFVPAIDIVVSHTETGTVLHMRGQPVKSVRIFMAFWFSFLLLAEVFLLTLAITCKWDVLFPVFVPVVMCVFGYFLCEIATKGTFKSVMKAIRKEFP